MSQPEGLGAIFLAHLQRGLGDRPTPERLDESLARVWEAARAAWPGIALDAAPFVRHLAERIQPGASLLRAFTDLHTADLYLACACALDLPGALRRFDEHHAETISRTARKVDRGPFFVDEVHQRVRHKLFIATPTTPARITRYEGRGALASWLVMVVQREALNLKREENSRDRIDQSAEPPLPIRDPELDALQSGDRIRFQEAFKAAIATLTPHERILLRLHVVEGQSHDQIASIYRVHQTTVSRQIDRARRALQDGVHAYYREHFKMSAAELKTLPEHIGSQIHLSLARLLA